MAANPPPEGITREQAARIIDLLQDLKFILRAIAENTEGIAHHAAEEQVAEAWNLDDLAEREHNRTR